MLIPTTALVLLFVFQPFLQTLAATFVFGDRIVVSDGPVNVRATANIAGTILGGQVTGSLGTVISGPVAQGGYDWLNINYDTGVDGWSAVNFLSKYVPPVNRLPTLTYQQYPYNDGVDPNTGTKNTTLFTFKVIFTDQDNDTPEDVTLHYKATNWATWSTRNMTREAGGSDTLHDGSSVNGETYTTPGYLFDQVNTYTYYFTTDDSHGGQYRLPTGSGTQSFEVKEEPLPQCSDGFDNDGDGLTDSNDPGCLSSGDNDESNTPPVVTLITLKASPDAGYIDQGVEPNSGTANLTSFKLKIVYTDVLGTKPTGDMLTVIIKKKVNGILSEYGKFNLVPDTSAGNAVYRNGITTDGEQYVYATTLPEGDYTYHFEVKGSTARYPKVGEGALSDGEGGVFSSVAPVYIVPIKAGTINPSLITDRSARLTGSVAPGGLPSEAFFLWRIQGEQATNQTESQQIGSGYSNVGVNEILTGLSPNTTYEYQVWGVNSDYEASGQWLSFKTMAPDINNTAPHFLGHAFEMTPSTALSPLGMAWQLKFAASATDAEDNLYYLIVCGNQSVSPGVGGSAPVCNGMAICVSDLNLSGIQAQCSYVADNQSATRQDWYAYVCDNHPTDSQCSLADQGVSPDSGDNSSPFYVNHPPIFTSVETTANNFPPASEDPFKVKANVFDQDEGTVAGHLELSVCATNQWSPTTGCASRLCSRMGSGLTLECGFLVGNTMPGTYTYYAFVKDGVEMPANSNPRIGNYTVSANCGDGVCGVNEASIITLLGKSSLTIPQGSFYIFPGATAVDANGQDISSAIVVTGLDSNMTLTLGTYTIRYNVQGAAEVTRTVNVVGQSSVAKNDKVTLVGVGGRVNADRDVDPIVRFSSRVSDVDGGKVKLQIDVRSIAVCGGKWNCDDNEKPETFATSNIEDIPHLSNLVNSGEIATVDVQVTNGKYHWRGRVVTESGKVGDWFNFGENEDKGDVDFTATDDFSFAHVTDIHLGGAQEGGWGITNKTNFGLHRSYTRFLDAITNIKERNSDLIVASGDLVEWANEQLLTDFQKIAIKTPSLYFVPGNHDRYETSVEAWGLDAEHLVFNPDDLLAEFDRRIKNNKTVHNLFSGEKIGSAEVAEKNYFFMHKGILFIGLDSGAQSVNGGSPESTGLTTDQITALNNSKIIPINVTKVVFLHNPICNAFNNEPCSMDDTEVDWSITKQRQQFLSYVINPDNNVQVVLSGHTHISGVHDKQGHLITNLKEQSRPLFIQTQSLTVLNPDPVHPAGYRMLRLKSGIVVPDETSSIAGAFQEKTWFNASSTGSRIKSCIYVNAVEYCEDSNNIPANLYFLPSTNMRVEGKNLGVLGDRIAAIGSFSTSKYKLSNAGETTSLYNADAFLNKREVTENQQYDFEKAYKLDNKSRWGDKAFVLTGYSQQADNKDIGYVRFEQMEINQADFNELTIDWNKLKDWWCISTIDNCLKISSKQGTGEFKGKLMEHVAEFNLGSPGELSVVDAEGRVTGLVNGSVQENIPYSIYIPDEERVIVFSEQPITSTEYVAKVVGNDNDTYDLDVRFKDDTLGQVETFSANYVPTHNNEIHEYVVDSAKLDDNTAKGVTLTIDTNGDGAPEQTTQIGNSLADMTAPITTIFIHSILSVSDIYYGLTNLTLTAVDNDGGVGVASTSYSLDNAPWQHYSTTTPIIVSTAGIHTIQYRSEDWFGNLEEIKSATFTIVKDTIAPVTTAKISGNQVQNGWYAGFLTITLDAKDNEGGSGVEKPLYSLNAGAWQTYSTTTPIKITTEGIHTLKFYSIDYFGNQEATNTIQIKIDKTAPEATVSFNLYSSDLEILGTDNLSKTKVVQVNDKTYTITDEAGNFTKLSFSKIKEKSRLVQARLESILYSTGGVYKLPKTNLAYIWDPFRNYVINQIIEVRQGFFVYANYDKRTNKTEIIYTAWGGKVQKIKLDGLKIIKLLTKKGELDYTY